MWLECDWNMFECYVLFGELCNTVGAYCYYRLVGSFAMCVFFTFLRFQTRKSSAHGAGSKNSSQERIPGRNSQHSSSQNSSQERIPSQSSSSQERNQKVSQERGGGGSKSSSYERSRQSPHNGRNSSGDSKGHNFKVGFRFALVSVSLSRAWGCVGFMYSWLPGFLYRWDFSLALSLSACSYYWGY